MRISALILAALLVSGCQAPACRDAAAKALIAGHCAACHLVPGVRTAVGTVGPSLANVGGQSIIAGRYPNSRAAMSAWIAHPQRLQPGSAMPDTGVTEAEARIIADYLYTVDSKS